MVSAEQTWDLAGRLTVSAAGLDAPQSKALNAQMDPFAPHAGGTGTSDVRLVRLEVPALVELHGPARDGLTTAVDADGRLLARYGGVWVEVPPPGGAALELGLQEGLALRACWADVVRPALHQAIRGRAAVAVHAAAVDGGATGGTLVAGWSESGKTEVALALVEAGARFLSDKWTVTSADREISAFPVGVGVRGWALDALPTLRNALPPRARRQLRAAQTGRRMLGPALDRPWSGRVTTLGARTARRGIELGDRAELSASALRRAYGTVEDPARRRRLETLVLLVNGPSVAVHVADEPLRRVAARLARSAAYERRTYHDLQERGAYAGLARGGSRDRAVAEEAELLSGVLAADVRVLQVTCPFPGDPRRVVDALLAAA
ncbi:MAG: hypothetical protein LC789_00730 [Actinobacteria bacterium]|nr:hypothetical protein [Actinomycetota bacterium]MCA1721419.1 hypothetical protein [Actinomycetota bacterium]